MIQFLYILLFHFDLLLLNKYIYLDEPYVDKDGDYIFPVSTFSYDGYQFKIVPYWENYYKGFDLSCTSFMMVGLNDSKKKISYLYYYNIEMDCLSEKNAKDEELSNRMIELIEDAFIWYSS